MKNQTIDTHKLLRLKQYEQPSEEYFDSFLEEFQRRQKVESTKVSAFPAIVDRCQIWLKELSLLKMATTASIAYATIMFGVMAWPSSPIEESSIQIMPVNGEEVLEMNIDEADKLDPESSKLPSEATLIHEF